MSKKRTFSIQKHFRQHFTGYVTSTLLLLFVVVYFWQGIFITINAGEAGVLYRRFGGGTVVDRVYPEGFHIISPFDIMTVYKVRLQTVAHRMEVLSSKGLKIALSLSIRYRPERQVLGVLHQEVGPDYLNRIILPEVEAKIRAILGQYEAEEIYTSKRGVVQEVVNESLAQVSQRFVVVDNVMITNIELPEKIREAIESKLEEQQLAAAYEFRLIREEKEAERKRIEAGGIKTYNSIVDLSLNDKLLQWKGVEATLALSKSPNSKVIIIGSGKDGLPVILDTNK
ncbi:MAG: prohibitin family protein [Proteobacteria bacterium]|nr:prohibitin family protein [Pseudomonadota bacterium]MBU1715011.1 prohibitin family protein [Pseudomonadota bacterium]